MGTIAIHASPSIGWHQLRAKQFETGLKVLGFDPIVTAERQRITDYSVLLGTTLWRSIEGSGEFLLVDRASVGDPAHVQLVWNGHGRRGDHCIPSKRRKRSLEVELGKWRSGERIVLCGQTETYSPHYETLEDWYSEVEATHFRPHPAGGNPTGLPTVRDWDKAHMAVTLNSSVAVDAVISGIPTVTMDEASMAWAVTSHVTDERVMPDRMAWLEWLAWTQWHWVEIEAGTPIKHLFERL